MFESFVNSERYKTEITSHEQPNSLRALLIQKDTKLSNHGSISGLSLRALLIQKDTKL